MSVRTTMDEQYDKLKDDLDELINKAIEMMCDNETWGHDEYRKGYRQDVVLALKEARDKI